MRIVIGVVIIAVGVASCSSLKLAPPPTAGEATALKRSFRVRHGPAEVQFTTTDHPEAIKAKLLSAFLDENLAVTSSQDLLVEARLPTDKELGVDYTVVARALVLPIGDTTSVRLYGERTASNQTSGDRPRVDAGTYGRGGATWLSLLKIAARLQPDSTKRTVVIQ